MPGTFDHTDEVDPSTIKTISGDLTAAYSNLDDWPVDPFWTTVNYKGPFGDPLEDGDMWLDGWSWLSDNDVLLIQTVEDTPGTTEVIEEYAWYVWVSIGVGALIGCAVSGKMMQSVGLTSGFKAGYQKAKDEDLTNIMTPAMEVQMSPRTQQMKITGGRGGARHHRAVSASRRARGRGAEGKNREGSGKQRKDGRRRGPCRCAPSGWGSPGVWCMRHTVHRGGNFTNRGGPGIRHEEGANVPLRPFGLGDPEGLVHAARSEARKVVLGGRPPRAVKQRASA